MLSFMTADCKVKLYCGKWVWPERGGAGLMTSQRRRGIGNEVREGIPAKTSLWTTCQDPAQMLRRRIWSTSSSSFPPTFSTSPMASHLVWSFNLSSMYTFLSPRSRVSKHLGAPTQRAEKQLNHARAWLGGPCRLSWLCLNCSHILCCRTNAGKYS